MSKPAAFILATTDSRADNLITRRQYLHEKLQRVHKTNEARLQKSLKLGLTSPSELYDTRPTMADIETSHVLFVREQYKPNVSVAFEYFRSNPEGGATVQMDGQNGCVRFNLSGNTGDYINDMVVRVVFTPVGTPDPINESTGAYDRTALRYRFTDKPGIRLLKKVSLKYDENTIADYTTRDALFYDKFQVNAEKRSGWNTLIGQENAHEGNYYHVDQRVNQCMWFKNGPQTLKTHQEPLELWIPLLFWCNRSVRESIAAGSIVTLQQRVELELESLDKILQAVDSNGNVVPVPRDANFRISDFELYTKNIYLDPEVSDLFKNRPSLSLIRVHKSQEIELTSPESRVHLKNLKFPLEHMYLGILPRANENDFDAWHVYGRQTLNEVSIPATIINPDTFPALQLVSRTGKFNTQTSCLQSFELTAHTTGLYKDTPVQFFNNYTPWAFDSLNTPADNDAYFVPFCLQPHRFESSGYVQLSKIREFYFQYTGEGITRKTPCKLIVSGWAINFLSIDVTGNAMLKFAT